MSPVICPYWCPIFKEKVMRIKHLLKYCSDYDPHYKSKISASQFRQQQSSTAAVYSPLDNEEELKFQPTSDSPIQIQQVDTLTRTCGYVNVNLHIHNVSEKFNSHLKRIKYQILIGLDIAEMFELMVDTKDKVDRVKDKIAELAHPLTNITQNKLFLWTLQVEKSFSDIKATLTSEPVLSTFNTDFPCKLYKDASAVGIAGILAQESSGEEHVIAHYSKKLLKRQQNYSACELECFVVMQAIGYFEIHLENKPFQRSSVNHVSISDLQHHQQQADLSFVKSPLNHQNTLMFKHRRLPRAVEPESFKQQILEEYHDIMSHPKYAPIASNYGKSPTSPASASNQTGLWHIPFPTSKITGQTQCNVISTLLPTSLPVKCVLTDNGKNFASKEFNKLLKVTISDNTYTTPYHPQCNGLCEKVNGTLMTSCNA
ncbi:hypothetical protein LAZ67_15000574 [Cordylochernes scorpioides]|uniref:Integrase catalytic domain-containing protein n=1 Tax=Cordylochernes scorpioides TaxID=51811 RepID=A0ABY6LCB1_9ARAC|nr:hypothetical protein LAZ67_15000574 [Cordylochernes scorpioides]